MSVDLLAMCSEELIAHLISKGISREICDQLEENAIDGGTLNVLMQDIDEFKEVLPKSGHRLQLKQKLAVGVPSGTVVKRKYCSEGNKENTPDLLNPPVQCVSLVPVELPFLVELPTPIEPPLPSMSSQNNNLINPKTFNKSFDDTFNKRRKFVEKEAESATQVLEECPYLGHPKVVRKEVCKIVGEKDWEKDAEKNLITALKAVIGIKENNYKMSSEQIVAAVETIEKKTKKNKGTTTSVLKFKDPASTMKPDIMFKDKQVEFRLVVIGSPEEVHQMFVAGEDQPFIETEGIDLVKGLVDLISCYYAYHVAYPENMEWCLLFFQDILLPSNVNVYRGTKYSAFMANIREAMQ